MAERTCTMPDCGKPYRAKGLCSTHYNRANPRIVEVPCAQCGTATRKEPGVKYANRFCSYDCRNTWRFWNEGVPRICRVPSVHPSRSPLFCCVPSHHPSRVPLTTFKDCEWCGTSTTRQRFCSRRCFKRAEAVRRRARESDGHVYSWTQVMRVFVLLGGRCAYCEQIVVGPPDPDHVVPLSRGGSNGNANVLPACRPCNSDKRDLLLHEWAEDRARRGKPPVRTVLNRSLPAFAHLLPDVFASSLMPHAA